MPEPLSAFKAFAPRAGILLDFDGTLSPLVDLPADARPLPGVTETLARLACSYRTVAIVSGRATDQLVGWMGPALDVWGVHGAERSPAGDGSIALSPRVSGYAARMSWVREEAERRLRELDVPGALVEDKGVMVVLHHRAAPDHPRAAALLRSLSDELATEFGVWQAEGKMAFELRPPVALSKGDVVEALAREAELEAVLFAGDDAVDLPAFDALDRLRDEGILTLRVGVVSTEAPAELARRADVTVEGPEGMLEFLRRLL